MNNYKFVSTVISVLFCIAPGMTKAGITKSTFGQFNGCPVELYTLTNRTGTILKITTYGGIITELHVPDRKGILGDVVLGYDSLEGYLSPEYERCNPNFGGIIGRYGNRIGKGKFTLDGVEYTLALNDAFSDFSKNHLHGGFTGFNRVRWTAQEFPGETTCALALSCTSKDMEEGYPGNLNVTVVYTLTDENELVIDYSATTDKPTVCNLTNHSYFNLSAGRQPTIEDHEVMIAADKYTEQDPGFISTGKILPVSGTPLDFTEPYRTGARMDMNFEETRICNGGYNHNFVLRDYDGSLRPVATVYDPGSGRYMEVLTTEPGIEFYTGDYLDGTLTGKKQARYVKRAGLCLETQHFPDSPNRPDFPSTVLRPGENYRTQTVYKFSTK
jgi:aldose 1-epimerase